MIISFSFAVMTLIILIFFTNMLKNENFRIVLLMMEISELFGVLMRGLIIILGLDNLVGPGYYYKIPEALLIIGIFNLIIISAIILTLFLKKEKQYKHKTQKAIINKLPNNAILISLIFLSIPGIFFDLSTFLNSNLIINPKLEAERIAVSGLGPLLTLMEFPVTALLIWYAVNNGKVTKLWWTALILLISRNLLMGSRSIMVTVFIILITLNIIEDRYKLKQLFSVKNVVLVFLMLYAGLAIISARGNLLHNGGTFFYWVKKAVLNNPINVIIQIYHSSFNGFDGLVSIVSFVPSRWNFNPGIFLYQSFTGLIPRAVWSSKWQVSMTEEFTQSIWGWAPNSGGNFMTGIGVLYMDSGLLGVIIGGLMIVLICYFTISYLRKLVPIEWINNFFTAIWAFFLFRFMFAGSVSDVIFACRLMIEFMLTIMFARMIRSIKFSDKTKYKTETLQ
jgi:hypothetical protein